MVKERQPWEVFDRILIGEDVCECCGRHGKVLLFTAFWDEELKFSTPICKSCLYEGLHREEVGNNKTRRELADETTKEVQDGEKRLKEYTRAGAPPVDTFSVTLEIARRGPNRWQAVEAERATVRLFHLEGGVCLEVLRDGQRFLGAMFTPPQAERLITRMKQQLRAGPKELYHPGTFPRCIGISASFEPVWEDGLKLEFLTYERVMRRYRHPVTPEFFAKFTETARAARPRWNAMVDTSDMEMREKVETSRVREMWID